MSRRRRCHRSRVRDQPVAIKSGLNQTPLAEVKFSFAGQEPLAEQHLGSLEHPAFYEVAVVSDQDILNEVGPVQQVHMLPADLEIGDVTVLARDVEEKIGRATPELRE